MRKSKNVIWFAKKKLRCAMECCGSCCYGFSGTSLTHVLKVVCTAVPDRASPAILSPWMICDHYKKEAT